ncbi:MAG: nucleotidyltransferase family protein [Parashewanella sp.]
MNEHEQQLQQWIATDPLRMRAILAVTQVMQMFKQNDYLIAAGFVRNLVWDKLHGQSCTKLTDIDVIYFNPADIDKQRDNEIEQALCLIEPSLPWSVKNQARMHVKHGDQPYNNCVDAMRYWPEQETAIGVRLINEQICVYSAFGINTLFELQLTHNRNRNKNTFLQRVKQKKWQQVYPKLLICC